MARLAKFGSVHRAIRHDEFQCILLASENMRLIFAMIRAQIRSAEGLRQVATTGQVQ
jgi:hypothetical protein